MHLKKGKRNDPLKIEMDRVEMSYDEMKEIYNVTENYESPIFLRFHWVDAHTGATCVSPGFMIEHGVGFIKDNVEKIKEEEDKPYIPRRKLGAQTAGEEKAGYFKVDGSCANCET